MYVIIHVEPNGTPPPGVVLSLPAWMCSRSLWVAIPFAVLNLYENAADLPAIAAQFGVPLDENWLHWLNTCGFAAAAYFRLRARQPLGIEKGRMRPPTPEELAALKEELRVALEKNPTPGKDQ